MRKIRRIIFIVLCAYAVNGYCQMYESALLRQIGTSLSLNDIYAPSMRDTSLFVQYHNHPVRIDIDSNHIITHIGYSIFPDSLELYSHIIERFIERYSLELTLHSIHKKSANQKMRDDNVRFKVGTYADLLRIDWKDPTQTVSLEATDKYYSFTIYNKRGITTSFEFPKDVQLIRGKDKVEIDKGLFMASNWNSCKHVCYIDTTMLQSIPLAPFKIIRGNYYLSDQLTNTIFVNKFSTGYGLLDSPRTYPKQTLQNIMLYGSDYDINLRIEHHRYGYSRVADTIPLNVWINLAYEDGCIPYWGIERIDADTIYGSYIWVNESLGYIHILFVEFPRQILLGRNDVVNCSLHSFVRMSNVTSLFYNTNHPIY